MGIVSELVLANVDERAKIHYERERADARLHQGSPRHRPAPLGRGGGTGVPQTSARARGRQTELSLRRRKQKKVFSQAQAEIGPVRLPPQAGYVVISGVILVHRPSEGDVSKQVSASLTSVSR